jgi:hypothetical protein
MWVKVVYFLILHGPLGPKVQCSVDVPHWIVIRMADSQNTVGDV